MFRPMRRANQQLDIAAEREMKKAKSILLSLVAYFVHLLLLAFLLFPVPEKDAYGTITGYHTVLYSYHPKKIVTEWDVSGNPGLVEYYIRYNGRILFVPYHIDDTSHLHHAQW